MTSLNNPYPIYSVRWLQFELQKQGYYFYRIDGDYGKKTKAAVRSFQDEHGLVPDGRITNLLVNKIKG